MCIYSIAGIFQEQFAVYFEDSYFFVPTKNVRKNVAELEMHCLVLVTLERTVYFH